MEQKPGRYWRVIGRQHLLRIFEQETEAIPIHRDSLFSPRAPVQNCFVRHRYRRANAPPEKRKFLRKQPTLVSRFYGQVVLQRRVPACLPAFLSAVLSRRSVAKAEGLAKEEVLTKGEAHRAKEGTSAGVDRASAGIRG